VGYFCNRLEGPQLSISLVSRMKSIDLNALVEGSSPILLGLVLSWSWAIQLSLDFFFSGNDHLSENSAILSYSFLVTFFFVLFSRPSSGLCTQIIFSFSVNLVAPLHLSWAVVAKNYCSYRNLLFPTPSCIAPISVTCSQGWSRDIYLHHVHWCVCVCKTPKVLL
jgi:hypothetical protein